MVYAATINPSTFPISGQYNTVSSLLNLIVPILILGAGFVFVILVIWAGFMYMNSDGNPEALKKIKSLFQYAIIGIGIVLGAYFIIKLFGAVFDIKTLFPF